MKIERPENSYAKTPLSKDYQPYSPEQIDFTRQDYSTESTKDLIGWTQEDNKLALEMGWSKAGLLNIRPFCEYWTIGVLINHRILHAPEVLDPKL